jgi:hypothetical protein
LNLREELDVKVFESTMLRIIFGSKIKVGTEGWVKLHNV